MTNFDFLKGEKQFAAFADACIEAEKSISASPALCALGVRKSAELAVKWLYSVDRSLRMPYKDNFSALVYNQSFIDSIDEDILDRLKFIIKLGNFSAHTSTKVTYKEAVLSLANLFDFILFIDYCYGENYQERIFDESFLAADNNQKISAEELDRLQKELEDRSKEREQMAEEMKKLQDQLEEMRRQNEQKRHYSANEKTEEETRKSIIDVDIKSMGWTIGNNCIEEYPVVGMPDTPTGTGSVDYVLFSDSHKPLAVLEAKRTTRDAKEGQHQAWLYANCLEQMTGFRPLIFYTNGYTTWLWDDLNYSERKVYSVFSRQDMQRIIDRREIQKDFRQLNINPEITDRPYQKMAIQSVCSDFSKKKRKALLVMATGTGKTRVSISLVDVLQDHRWITNILFLADRVELVKQAKKAFVKHLPNLSTCNLLERGDDKPTDRAIFSTYPTIMNAINDEKTDDGQKLFTPGHFDLIIVDEAHRSIFKKYRAIFEYFDALLVGLTATPKKDVGHNTYDFFDLEDDMPTYAYEYAEARDAGWLADYHSVEKLFKIPTEGINPDNLTDEQRQELEDSYDDDEAPDFISSADIDTVVFNKNTTQRILSELMEKGIKVEGGDKLGKTIIFAKRHKHALFIEEQFNKLYPQYMGKFARVIDNQVDHHDSLLEAFKDPTKLPQIAISVDMLDTGIDVPEVVNLVFYKQVFSASKFWQMFGRGTRLCEDLFGPGEDKKEFYIFDYMGNFEFFKQNPQGKDAADTGSLAEKAFSLKVHVIQALQKMEYQTEELIPFRKALVDELSSSVAALNVEQFQVRQNLEYVEKYSKPDAFQYLDILEADRMIAHLARLMPPADGDEYARRFDVVMFQIILAKIDGNTDKFNSFVRTVKRAAVSLEQKATIPEVIAAKDTLAKAKSDSFWQSATLPDIDQIREEMRGLMHFLRREIKTKVINVTDDVIFEREGEQFTQASSLESYYERARRYVDENADEPVLNKLKNNIPLDQEDWDALERIFWSEVGTADEYRKEFHNEDDEAIPLGKFVRSLTGLDKETAEQAFNEFLDTGLYTTEQITFVRCIIDWIVQYGTLERQDMAYDEFSGGLDVVEVFGDNIIAFEKIMSVVEGINANAMPMAA